MELTIRCDSSTNRSMIVDKLATLIEKAEKIPCKNLDSFHQSVPRNLKVFKKIDSKLELTSINAHVISLGCDYIKIGAGKGMSMSLTENDYVTFKGASAALYINDTDEYSIQ